MRPGISWRLFLTCCIVYLIHFAPNVVRETYLAVALAEDFTVRVDPYLGLHPDLFEIEGRGAYINSNPGASVLGAVPYAAARPIMAVLFRLRPDLVRPKPAAAYDDPRPNRTRFMNEARARGLDVKLVLAAAAMHLGLMVPLGALAVVVVFQFLRTRLGEERKAFWFALLYAFGTPIFFRTGYLSQNGILAHLTLFAYLLLARESEGPGARDQERRNALLGAGGLLGLGVVCDYSGVPLIVAFGLWILLLWGFRSTATFAAGGFAALLLLLGYQWIAFGHPLFPAQAYMPPTPLSVGWHGIQWPQAELLFRNLLDPRYGLFVFCPMLVAAFAAPVLRARPGGPSNRELALIFGATSALYLFNSSVQYAALQFNTGVRYMVPAVPLLFLAVVPVVLRMPTWLRYVVVVPTVVISWSVAMVRESVPRSLEEIVRNGPQLPWLITLRKTAQAYAPALGEGTLVPLAIALLALTITAILVWLIWRRSPSAQKLGTA
jgi:hypothetical protein